MKSATERWLRVGMALVATAGIVYFFLSSGGESRREFVRRQNQEFNEFIRGEIRWIDDIDGRSKVYYLRLDSVSVEQYDSRDSAMGYPYAVVRDTCAAVVEFQKGKEVGDILEVRGSTDSVYVYREGKSVYSGVRTVWNYGPFIEDAKGTIDMSRCGYLDL